MYKSYADKEYYANTYKGTTIPDNALENVLLNASRHIDSLTFNRIIQRGLDNIAPFSIEIIKKVNCLLAEFEYENSDYLNSAIGSYSILGVGVDFNKSPNITTVNGVTILKNDYNILAQTGLCMRLL